MLPPLKYDVSSNCSFVFLKWCLPMQNSITCYKWLLRYFEPFLTYAVARAFSVFARLLFTHPMKKNPNLPIKGVSGGLEHAMCYYTLVFFHIFFWACCYAIAVVLWVVARGLHTSPNEKYQSMIPQTTPVKILDFSTESWCCTNWLILFE